MSLPKSYRHPWRMLLIIVLIFGLLFGVCWFWYEKQLDNLNKHLDELQHKAAGSVMEKTRLLKAAVSRKHPTEQTTLY